MNKTYTPYSFGRKPQTNGLAYYASQAQKGWCKTHHGAGQWNPITKQCTRGRLKNEPCEQGE